MLTSSLPLLIKAQKKGYAVGAFNVNNLEMIQAIIEAAREQRSPVILQTSEGAIEYAGIPFLAAMVKVAAQAKIPVAFHLDHGKDFTLVKQMISLGLHTSVMFDGSSLSFQKNVEKTKAIVRLAHQKGIQVEAELGAIAGIEDFVSVEEKDAHLTSPEQAGKFARFTECDSLAIAIGTSHGAYKFSGQSHLDIKRLTAIRQATNVPLVLHGASEVPPNLKRRALKSGCQISEAKGVSANMIKQAIAAGVCKINVDTDLRIAFTTGVRESLNKGPSVIDPRVYLGAAKSLMKQTVIERIRQFGSSQKA